MLIPNWIEEKCKLIQNIHSRLLLDQPAIDASEELDWRLVQVSALLLQAESLLRLLRLELLKESDNSTPS